MPPPRAYGNALAMPQRSEANVRQLCARTGGASCHQVVPWRRGEKIKVDLQFDAGVARITIHFKGRTETRVLEGVPDCGLCFGVGICGYQKSYDDGGLNVALIEGELDADARSALR